MAIKEDDLEETIEKIEYSKEFNEFKEYISDVKQIIESVEKTRDKRRFSKKLLEMENTAKIFIDQKEQTKENYKNSFSFLNYSVKNEMNSVLNKQKLTISSIESENIYKLLTGKKKVNSEEKFLAEFGTKECEQDNSQDYKALCLFDFDERITKYDDLNKLFNEILGIAVVEYCSNELGINFTLNDFKNKKVNNTEVKKVLENFPETNLFKPYFAKQFDIYKDLFYFLTRLIDLKEQNLNSRYEEKEFFNEIKNYLNKNKGLDKFLNGELNQIKNRSVNKIKYASARYENVEELKKDFDDLKETLDIEDENDEIVSSLIQNRGEKLLINYKIGKLLGFDDKFQNKKRYKQIKDVLNYINSEELQNFISSYDDNFSELSKQFWTEKTHLKKPSNGIYVPENSFKNIKNDSKSKYIPSHHLKKSFGRNLKKNVNRR